MVFRTLEELGGSNGNVRLLDKKTVDHNVPDSRGACVVLSPEPTTHPDDPLNWPQWKKLVIFLNLCAFGFFTTFSYGGLSPALHGLSIEFRESPTTTTGLIIWPLLLLGFGNFFWVPTASYWGKRPVFVVASLLLFGCNVWAACSQSSGSLLAARILLGFAGSSQEALGAAVVNDLFFVHERGAKVGLYVLFFSTGNTIGSLVAGFIIEGAGWRWFVWVAAICTGINFISIVFLVPETRYPRLMDPKQGTSPQGSGEKLQLEVFQPSKATIPYELISPQKGKTYLASLKMWSGTPPDTNYFKLFIRPFPLIAYPPILWASLNYSVSIAGAIAVGSLNPFVLQVPPYKFSPGINGLINVPATIGNIVGVITGGYLTDLYAVRQAQRNNGIFVPESRLVFLVIPAVLGPAGLLMFGFGSQHHLHWIVLFIGYGFINAALTCVANISLTYVLDSYFPIAAEALLVINGFKNVVAFGFVKGLVSWLHQSGYTKMFGTLTGVFLGMICLAIPMYLYGARVRQFTYKRFRLISW